jgi:DNA modification methylase
MEKHNVVKSVQNSTKGKRPDVLVGQTSVVKKINQLHKEFIKMTVKKALEIGRLLVEQKTKLGHGNWEDWMGTNLEFSAATAKRYMRLYEVRDELKTVTMTDLSLTEIYEQMNSRTKEEHQENTDYYREQNKERDARREAFADRKHNYVNPTDGIYEDRVICGNSLEVMQNMIDAGHENSYDNIIFSPPYNNRLYYGPDYKDDLPYPKYLAMLKEVIALSYKLLRKGGRLIINIDDMTRLEKGGDHHYTLESDLVQIIRTMDIELYELDKIIWFKSNSGTQWRTCWGSHCSPSSPKLRNCFESILIYSKEEHVLPNTYNTKPDITKEEFEDWTFNVWEIHPNSNSPHPASYTEKLTNRLIKLYSFPKCKILDPFCGSGTTLKSAQIFGRSYTGIDLNPNYAQYSRDRLDLTPEQLKDKYAEFLGGKKPKETNKTEKDKTKKLVVSKLKKNISICKDKKGVA